MLAATEAIAARYGGIAAVSRATGIAAGMIGHSLKYLYDFVSKALGRAVPYGIYDIADNAGGQSRDGP